MIFERSQSCNAVCVCYYQFVLKTPQRRAVSKFKGRVHCFSMQVVMNRCFLLNPEKKLTQIRVIFEKNTKNALLIPKMTSPIRRLGYCNNQLKSC